MNVPLSTAADYRHFWPHMTEQQRQDAVDAGIVRDGLEVDIQMKASMNQWYGGSIKARMVFAVGEEIINTGTEQTFTLSAVQVVHTILKAMQDYPELLSFAVAAYGGKVPNITIPNE